MRRGFLRNIFDLEKQTNWKTLLLFPLLTAVVSGFSWYSPYFFLLELIAFIPLLISIYTIREKKISFWKKIGLLLVLVAVYRIPQFYIGVSWIPEVTIDGFVLLLLFEIIIFTAILWVILIRKIPFYGIVFLLIIHEFLTQQLGILPPFYLLGFSWAERIEIVQFYSIIGIEGTSLLFYLINYLFFKTFYLQQKMKVIDFSILGVLPVLILYSLIQFYGVKDLPYDETAKISVIHTNVPLENKKTNGFQNALIDSISKVAAPQSLVALPEEIFYSLDWVDELDNNHHIQKLKTWSDEHEQVYIGGAFAYGKTTDPGIQSVFSKRENTYYNIHNISMLIQPNTSTKVKSKRIFLPFFEYIPDNFIFRFINNYFTNIGASYQAIELDRDDVFRYKRKKFDVLVCYESMFPLFVSKKAKNNDFFVIQTEEGWLPNKKGQEQYIVTTRALAIQSGTPMYKTSNYGMAGFFTSKGKMEIEESTGDYAKALIYKLPLNKKNTIYNYISGYTYIFAFGFLLFLFVHSIFLTKKGNL